MSSSSDQAPAALAETHSAWVILLGERAYKIKKPVDLGFLDFTSRSAREAIAHREVELNRRLAPDVYLGVADILGPDGVVCDHMVVMRRMPENRRLSTLVQGDAELGDQIRAIARAVAAFHERAVTSPEIAAAGAPPRIRAKVDADLADMRASAGTILDAAALDHASGLVGRYLDGRAPLLLARVADGRIRDGHGDLLAGDIFCLPDGPRILDCLEFDDQLRYVDVIADVAFLAMDLEHLGAPDLADEFVDAYREFSAEHHPASLIHFYIATRALIRSKVSCIRAGQGDRTARTAAAELLTLANEHLDKGRVQLVLVGGPPGTGKSTIAAALADRLGWVMIRSDEVRKDLFAGGHRARAEANFGEGIYDEATTAATYEAMLQRARLALTMGECVVLDASWSRARWRDQARVVADDAASDLIELRADAPLEVAIQRVRDRGAHTDDVSDATPEVTAEMSAGFDPWPSARVLTTTAEPDHTIEAALSIVAAG